MTGVYQLKQHISSMPILNNKMIPDELKCERIYRWSIYYSNRSLLGQVTSRLFLVKSHAVLGRRSPYNSCSRSTSRYHQTKSRQHHQNKVRTTMASSLDQVILHPTVNKVLAYNATNVGRDKVIIERSYC